MNWGVSDVGDRAVVSFSDAHSAPTMGRELTILEAELDYDSVTSALFENRVLETVEFHPEHGKYHENGHRKCGVQLTPAQTPSDGRCLVCNRPLTLGVLHRVNELSDRDSVPAVLKDGLLYGASPNARPFRQLVPLRELIATALSAGVNSKKVASLYTTLTGQFESELAVLTIAPETDIAAVAGAGAGNKIAASIVAVREGRVDVEPGFDGVFGNVTALL